MEFSSPVTLEHRGMKHKGGGYLLYRILHAFNVHIHEVMNTQTITILFSF